MDFAVGEFVDQPWHSWENGVNSVLLPWTAELEPGFFEVSSSAFLPQAVLAPSSQQAEATVLAQQFDQDVLGDLGNAWNTFIESGQIWALIIGLVLGYLMRGLTTY